MNDTTTLAAAKTDVCETGAAPNPPNAGARIVRYGELRPCYDAFIDTRTPGSAEKENFTIIGPGVSENPNQYVHIAEPHGFNIGGARQPPGCRNSQHSHDTAEVFYVHSGRWRFDAGETADDAHVELGPGDLISIPTQCFRGFTNIGDDIGFLWAVLGGDDPGRVLWAPDVFDLAKDYGLILLDDGTLVDTAKGETIPPGKAAMPVTTRAQVDALRRFTDAQMEAIVDRGSAATDRDHPRGALNAVDGVSERMLVGGGRMDWPHGFTISEVVLEAGAATPSHALDVCDVWFVHKGAAVFDMEGEPPLAAGPGDTVTLTRGRVRRIRNVGDDAATLVAVRGGDAPATPRWRDIKGRSA